MSTGAPRHVFLSCGEASGERYGAALVRHLRDIDPGLRISCLGGPALRAAGADVIVDARELSVMGFTEVLGVLPQILRARRRAFRFLRQEGVDLVVPLDFPGFNSALAGQAKAAGIPVFWLIAPQVWAWGGWRIGGFRRRIDRLGTILPFEQDFFSERGFDVFPMGHPLMDDYGNDEDFEAAVRRREARLKSSESPLTISLLPGSRRQELDHLLPILKVTAKAMRSMLEGRELRILVSAAPGVEPSRIAQVFDADEEISTEPLSRLLAASDLALVCSGTASLEATLAGVPHEVVYRTGGFNYWLARKLVKTRYIALSNLILDSPVVREHIQDEAAPLPLARAASRWVAHPDERAAYLEQVRRLRGLCGQAGVWRRTAQALIDTLDGAGHGSR